MLTKYILPAVALLLLGFAVFFVVISRQDPPQAAPPVAPPSSPFGNTVAGAGILEPRSENISVGSPVPGIVSRVFVEVGQKVYVGDPLFQLDEREIRAQLEVREAALAAARAEWNRLEQQPRPEQIPVSEAQVREAEARLGEQQDNLYRLERLYQRQATTEGELRRAEEMVRSATAAVERAQAELRLLQAGAWQYDKDVARAEVARAEAEVEQIETDLSRLVVRAQVEGEVLQVNVRPGEFVGAPSTATLILLGDTERLHVRVDIDEHDIPRFDLGAPAVASLRGQPGDEFPLTFVRVEPYVVPKRSLTGDNIERVDTRVLQVIYSIDALGNPLYVGQQVDVFMNVDAQRPPKQIARNGS